MQKNGIKDAIQQTRFIYKIPIKKHTIDLD